MASANLRKAALNSPKTLYKFLLRECDRLPEDAQNYYKHTIRQSYKQHVVEPDTERVRQIMEKAFEDAKWIIKKTSKGSLENNQSSTMEFVELVTKKTDVSSQQFWRAMDIWSRNPHVENRRILTSDEILTVGTKKDVPEIFNIVESLELSSGDVEDSISKTLLNAGLSDLHCLEKSISFLHLPLNEIYLRVTKLLPRMTDLFSPGFEFTIVSPSAREVTIIHKSISKDKRCLGPTVPYRISHSLDGLTGISIKSLDKELAHQSNAWLAQNLFPRLLKWMQNDLEQSPTVPSSLSLIPSEKYARLYETLKKKYGTEMVKIWPENTDPKKFVYEDVAIATYLLVLWEKERQEKGIEKLQSFVDLGCGNGLLVHILTSEGHSGIGIDLRKRKIWDLFPCRESLQVSTIVPSSMTLFPGTDWIIGNHSDELTPWVPVIAARTPPDCRFFLLPCCAYEFDGSKYQRSSTSKSQYSDYIDYVKSVCEGCGFKTELDRLRIPSTKRICLIGWERTNTAEDLDQRDLQIQKIINARTTTNNKNSDLEKSEKLDEATSTTWSCNFKPRDAVEKVRNCTQIDKTLQAEIVNIVVDSLLRNGRTIILKELPGKSWNAGRSLELSEIADLIPREMLVRLRNECGGLQTLLRNHGHIFNVIQGKVSIRQHGVEVNKRKRKIGSRPVQLKAKSCWFHVNHPNGCPRLEENCTFKH